MANSKMLLALEDNVSCPICLDIYDEPTRLDCEHSLCQRCIELFRLNTVTCPICSKETSKENLKKNLSLQAIVDFYKNQQMNQPSTSGTGNNTRKRDFQGKIKVEMPDAVQGYYCELCNILEAQFYCNSCDKIACLACKTSHLNFTTCLSNGVEEMEFCSARRIMALNDKLQRIRRMETEFNDQLREHLSRKEAEVQESTQAVDDFENSVMEEIRKHCTMQRECIKEYATKHETELTETYISMVDKLNSCGQEIEQGTFVGGGHLIKLYQSLSQSASEVLERGENFHVSQKKICVASHAPKDINYEAILVTRERRYQNALPFFPPMADKTLQLEKTLELPDANLPQYHCTSLFHRNDDILCFHRSKLYKVDLENGILQVESTVLLPGKTILASYFQSIGMVVVVEGQGLFILVQGNTILLSDSSYQGLFCHEDQIFALALGDNGSYVRIDTFTSKMMPTDRGCFSKSSTIFTKVPIKDNTKLHPIAVNKDNIFIADCYFQGDIYRLDEDGDILQTYKLDGNGQGANEPWIVASDEYGRGTSIIQNMENGQLLVFDLDLNDKLFQKVNVNLRNVTAAIAHTSGRFLFVAEEKDGAGNAGGVKILAICS